MCGVSQFNAGCERLSREAKMPFVGSQVGPISPGESDRVEISFSCC